VAKLTLSELGERNWVDQGDITNEYSRVNLKQQAFHWGASTCFRFVVFFVSGYAVLIRPEFFFVLSLTADLHQTLVKRQVVHPLWEDSASLSAYIAVTGTSNIRFKEDSIYSIVTLKKGWTVFSG
jgi:hypothetical protein